MFNFSRHMHSYVHSKKMGIVPMNAVSLDRLPNELILEVFSHLEKTDIARCLQAFDVKTRTFDILENMMSGSYDFLHISHCDVFDSDANARSIDRNSFLIKEVSEVIKLIHDGYGNFIHGHDGKGEHERTRVFVSYGVPLGIAWPNVVIHTPGLTPIYEVDLVGFDLIIIDNILFSEFPDIFPEEKTWMKNKNGDYFRPKLNNDNKMLRTLSSLLIEKLTFSELEVAPRRRYNFISEDNFYYEKWTEEGTLGLEIKLNMEREKRLLNGSVWP